LGKIQSGKKKVREKSEKVKKILKNICGNQKKKE